jgi:hypothetical protein
MLTDHFKVLTDTRSICALRSSSLPAGFSLILCFTFSIFGGVACDEMSRPGVKIEVDAGVVTREFSGESVGGACNGEILCRRGLSCVSGLCEVDGTANEDEPCIRTDECVEGLKCGWAGFCVPEGEKEVDEACGHDGECRRGFACMRLGGIAGQCMATPQEGLGLYEACDAEEVCADGLICSSERSLCLPNSLLLNPDAFRGVACDDKGEAEMPFGVRHALPHEGADFFATPFPSDLRMSSGKLDLRDYPRPGATFSDRDLFDRLLNTIEELREGWSRNPGIYMRLTRPLKEEQIEEVDRHFKLIDLETGELHALTGALLPKRNKYICSNAIFLHPIWGRPLTPGHSYAALALNTLRSIEGETPEKLDSLTMLLKSKAPSEDVQEVAWRRFAPLRQWLIQTNEVELEDIVGATIFTVRARATIYEEGREAVYDADIPRFDLSPILCEEGVTSPCATPSYTPPEDKPMLRDPRDCPETPNPKFHEIHAKVRMPIFQRGELPYQDEGGRVPMDGNQPQLTGYRSICIGMTVPKEVEPPETGWPVVIYAHGTNGDFRGGAKRIAAKLSPLTLAEGEEVAVATIAIDQVMHGDRVGDDQTLSPGPLFFNVKNPIAARGNLIQGALDNFALVRFLRESPSVLELSLDEIGSIRFNPDLISYHGHSQGGTTGPLFAPFEDELNGVAFSGTAGGLIFSLTGKKEPYDSTIGLRLTLQELNLDPNHPALHVFQELFDDVDPINFAELLFDQPHGKPIHTMQIMGLNDTFTPDSGQRSYAAALGGVLARPNIPPSNFDEITDLNVVTSPYPVEGNVQSEGSGPVTGVIVQHTPQGQTPYNGHFVAYLNRVANRQLLHFLGDLSLGNVPKVEEGEE